MRTVITICIGLMCFFKPNVQAAESKKSNKVLVFSLTTSFRHKSIKEGILAIRTLGVKNNFEVDTSENVTSFTNENLKQYKTLIFLNPTGSNVFSEEQKQAFKEYIHNGGGLVGIHAATDFCFEWEWYGKMIGAFFTNHPKVQQAKLIAVAPKNKLMKGIPQTWLHTDEWYNFRSLNPDVKVLVKVDEMSYQGGTMNNEHPVVWYHEFEGGRVFYTAMGHTPEAYTNKLFLTQLQTAIKWTMRK